ncbi:MAG: DUF945 family protein [Vibrio sp.]
MNSIKKFAAIGGVVAIAACWPLAIGQFAQNTIQTEIGKLSKDEVNLELVKYDRGYLNSTAQTKVTVVEPVLKQQMELEGLPTSFTFNHTIHHGLFSLSTDSKPEDYQTLPMDVHSVTYLNGSSAIDINTQKMTLQLKQSKSSFELSPLTLHVDAKKDGYAEFNYKLDSMNGHFGSGESLMITALNGSGEGQKKGNIWIGKQDVTLGESNMIDNVGESVLDINQLHYKFDTVENAKQGTFSSTHQVSADSVEIEDDTLNSLVFNTSFKDIDMQAFSNILSLYQNPDKQFGNQEMKALMGYLDTVFEKGFTLSLDKMSTTIGEGKFNTDLTLQFPAGKKGVSQNPMQIMSSFNGGVNAFVSNEMEQKFPFIKQGLDNLIKQGVMSQKADGYYIKGDIKEGKVEFEGGKSMPLFALLAPLFL